VTEEPALVIDALGRRCPLPVIDLAKRIGDVPVGAVVEIVADDPAAAADIPAWCRMREHDYVAAVPRGAGTGYRVRRAH
jgi:TusA-related sulfurtransferase